MGAESRTRIALLGLLVVALFDFLDVFVDGSFMGPALLGIALAVLITAGGRRLGVPPVITLVVGLVIALIYVSGIFEPSLTIFGLPTPASISALIDAARSAYAHSALDFAPVAVRPGYALLITVAFSVAAAVGEVATFRWRRPLLAMLPAIALFALSLVVGSGKTSAFWVAVFLLTLLTFLATEASYSARFWGRWVTAWSDHASQEGRTAAAPLARRMAAVCVGGALIAPVLVPGIGNGLLHWRNHSGHGSGGGGAGVGPSAAPGSVDPLVSIVPHLIRQTRSVLFTVRTDDPEYIRLTTLTNFDGVNWTAPTQHLQPVSRLGSVAPTADMSKRSKVVNETVTIDNLTGQPAPSVEGATQAILGNGAGGKEIASTSETGDLRIPDGLDSGLNYETSSTVPDITSYREIKSAQIGRPSDSQLVELPRRLSRDVISLRDKWIEGEQTPMQQLVAIQSHLRSFTYEITSNTKPTQDYLSQFLLVNRTGYCQQFATAFALLARSLHYPARVVVGFLPGRSTKDGVYDVRGTDAHAWPEVFFKDFGWVRFEPTPRSDSQATADAPAYTGPPGASGTGPGSAGTTQTGPTAGKDGRVPRTQEGAATVTSDKATANRKGTGHRQPPVWYPAFKRLAGAIALILALLLLAIPIARWAIVRRRYSHAGSDSGTAVAAFAQFEDRTASLSLPRRPSESAAAFAMRVAGVRALPLGLANRLASIYEAAEYSLTGVTRPDASEARSLAERLNSSMWTGASPLDKALMIFSPRSLLLHRQRRIG